ncbi:MAG: hypothetical protein ACKPE6_09230 [Gammaproteobacteria bacterium]
MIGHKTTAAVLCAGVVLTIAALLRGAGSPEALLNGLSAWALAPYAVFLACNSIARTRRRAIATLVVSGLATGSAAIVYVDGMFLRSSSTSGLVFVFIPLYQLVVAGILLLVLAVTGKTPERAG